MDILSQEMAKSSQQEPGNRWVSPISVANAETRYSYLGPLGKLLTDYSLFLRKNLEQQKGIHCILHEARDHRKQKALGVASIGEPYMLLSLSRSGSVLARHILHEMSHCLGAKHNYFPFGFMYPTANSIFGKSFYWDPFSRNAVRKGLEKFEYQQSSWLYFSIQLLDYLVFTSQKNSR